MKQYFCKLQNITLNIMHEDQYGSIILGECQYYVATLILT